MKKALKFSPNGHTFREQTHRRGVGELKISREIYMTVFGPIVVIFEKKKYSPLSRTSAEH